MSVPFIIDLQLEREKRRPKEPRVRLEVSRSMTPGLVVFRLLNAPAGLNLTWTLDAKTARTIGWMFLDRAGPEVSP